MATAVGTLMRLQTADEFFDFVHRPENRDRFFELERGVIIEVRPGKEPYALGIEDEISGEDVLPDLKCRVADFFRLPGEQD